MKRNIILVILSLILYSCSINGSFQGLYSYYNKTKSQNSKLFKQVDSLSSICEFRNKKPTKIYIINGKMLKECIDTEKVLIYMWSPKCKSKVCYPLELLQNACDEKRIKLFIVAEYYDLELMQLNYEILNPIFGIDTNYYKSDMTKIYVSKFIFDLTDSNKTLNRFITFNEGKYENSFNDFENVFYKALPE